MNIYEKIVVLGFTEDSVCYIQHVVPNAKPCGQNAQGGYIYDALVNCRSYEEFKNFLFTYQTFYPVVICEQNIRIDQLPNFLLQLQAVDMDTYVYICNFSDSIVKTYWGTLYPLIPCAFKNGENIKIFSIDDIDYVIKGAIKHTLSILATWDNIEKIEETNKEDFKTHSTVYTKSITTPNVTVSFKVNLSMLISETSVKIEIINKQKIKNMHILPDGNISIVTKTLSNVTLNSQSLQLSDDLDTNVLLILEEILEMISEQIILV